MLDNDEFIRPGTTVETLGKLKPSFEAMGDMGGFDAVALQKYHWIEKIDHVHTPGNSSGIVDGASLLAIGNEQTGNDLGLKPQGADPRDRGRRAPTRRSCSPAPHPRRRRRWRRPASPSTSSTWSRSTRRSPPSSCASSRDMGLDMEKVNVNGGAIAMGHPLGATGGMILGTLVDELHRTGGKYGLATLCVGGGMGIATVVEAI